VLRYLAGLSKGQQILWCYAIWYAVVLVRHFDPSPRLWATSLGLSAIIGTALYISTAAAGRERRALGFWPTFRLYLMPFCVSSFAALVKDRGFVLVFSPQPGEIALALGLCAGFCALIRVLKRSATERSSLV
jgi:hypothetical protein